MTRLRSVFAVPLLAALLALAPAASASAEGSVPSEVAAYVADGSLVAQLNDVYGVGAGGEGIDFDETTTMGVIERVHHFSDELREGEETDHPLDLANEWIVPISIAEEPVGLATVWINPASVRPELATFDADPELATALSAVPDGASLVHDETSVAWLALAADGTLTPLVAGTTGLSTPVPIDDIALLPAEGGSPGDAGDPATGVGFAIAVILLLLAIIVVALVLPTLRKKKQADDDGEPHEHPHDSDATPRQLEAPAEEEAPAEAEAEAAEDVVVAPPAKKPRPPRKPKAPPQPAEDPES
jgi:hypothetical protein